MPNENQQQADGTPPAKGDFDPYREWLGVTVSAPNYYELLGLPDEEQNVTRIAAAADRAIARVRSHRPGERAKHWSRLLDELKSIKQTLTRPETKQEYDATLGSQKKKGVGKGSGKSRRAPPPAQYTPDSQNKAGKEIEDITLDAMGLPPLGSSNQGRDVASSGKSPPLKRLDEGLDLSFLNSPPAKPLPPSKSENKTAPPLSGELSSVPDDSFEQVDDIVLPPSIQPVDSTPSSDFPRSQPLPAATPSDLPKVPRVRANPMLATRRRKQGAWRTRVMSGLMSGLLIALGVYAFIFFEEPNGDNPLRDGFPEMTPRESLLSDEQRAAILAESERRSQEPGTPSEDELDPAAAAPDNSPSQTSEETDSASTPSAGGDDAATTDRQQEQADIFPDASDQPNSDQTNTDQTNAGNSAEQEQFQAHLKAIRLALSEHRLDDVAGLLDQARPLARKPNDSARLDSFEQVAGLLAEFQTAVKRAMASMGAGTSFPISATSEVVVVERLPDAIRIRLAGQNHLFPLDDLPLMLGRALAERGMPSGPHAQTVLGAFQAVHKRARPEHLEEVRRWWQEAKEEGEDVEKLLLILPD